MAFLNFKRKPAAQFEDKRQAWGVEGAAPLSAGLQAGVGQDAQPAYASGYASGYASSSHVLPAGDDLQRARYRLLGAAVLVLVLGLLLVLVFDAKPRPMPLDTPIVMGQGAQPLPANKLGNDAKSDVKIDTKLDAKVDASPARSSNTAAVTAALAPVAAAPAEKSAQTEPAAEKLVQAVPVKPQPNLIATEAKPKPEAKPEAGPEAGPEKAIASKTQPAATPKPARSKAESVVEADGADDTPKGRFIVQMGAFEDNASARALRLKLEAQGIKTYAQVATVKGARLIRIRVGPYKTRAEADQTAKRLKALGHEAGIYQL